MTPPTPPTQPDPTQRKTKTSLANAFATIIWPRRYLLSLGFILIVISRFSSLALPWISMELIDEVIPEQDYDYMKFLLWLGAGAIIAQAITSFFLVRLLSVEAQFLIKELRTKIQRHVIQMPIRYFDNTKSGELVSRIMTDVEGVRNLVGTGFVQLFGGGLTAIAAFFILINLNAWMTLYTLVPLAIFGLITAKAFGYIRPIFRLRRKINAEVTGRLTESLGGIRVIKGFNAENHEIDVFEEGTDRLFQNVKRTLTATSLLTSSSTLLLGLASIGVMGIGGWMMMSEKMKIGEFFAFTMYLAFLLAPIMQMSNIGSQLVDGLAGLDRMEEILQLERENDQSDRTHTLGPVAGDIVFDDVCFAYDEGKEVVNNISFDAPAGSVTALIGSSGSGKTTIAGLAASFMAPGSGTVTIDGVDLSTVTIDSYRNQLGVVLQDDFLFEGTIRDNILFARPDANDQQVADAAKAAHVNEFADRFDEGLDTRIGERGVKLSGGQRQRVAIARALLANPKILILDEATSSLDTESEQFIQESLDELLKNRTTFVIAHRLSTIRRADQILVIEGGRIVERGTHDELITSKGRYHELYTYQARI
jgi:ABC-type multidrug transport system fused ATPase/permease subunit